VHTRRIHRLKGSLRVTEYSGGGTVQRKAQRRNRTTEGSVKLCQEGIERVHRVHQRTPFRVLRKEKCRREDTHRVVEYSVGSARCASSRRTPGGRKEFSFQENFSESELFEILECKGVQSRSKSRGRTKLRRDSVSITQTRPKGTGLARGRVEGRDLRDLENILSQKAKKAQEESAQGRQI
jgi:hypothetical protein